VAKKTRKIIFQTCFCELYFLVKSTLDILAATEVMPALFISGDGVLC